jgi:hypothetical protein
LNLPLVCLKCLRRKCTALEHFPVPTERSGTVLTIMGTPLEHCNFFPSYLFFPRSAPLCATMIGTALEHLFLPRSAEQSGTVMTMMGQCSGAISIPVARSRTGKDEMYKRPVFCGVIHHCNTERNGKRCTGERMPVFWGVIRHCSTERNGERCTGERMPVFWGVIRHCSTERNGAGKR